MPVPSAGGVGFVQDVVEDASESLGFGLGREPALPESGKHEGGASGRRSRFRNGLGMGRQRVLQPLFHQGVQGDAALRREALDAREETVFDVEGDLHEGLHIVQAPDVQSAF